MTHYCGTCQNPKATSLPAVVILQQEHNIKRSPSDTTAAKRSRGEKKEEEEIRYQLAKNSTTANLSGNSFRKLRKLEALSSTAASATSPLLSPSARRASRPEQRRKDRERMRRNPLPVRGIWAKRSEDTTKQITQIDSSIEERTEMGDRDVIQSKRGRR